MIEVFVFGCTTCGSNSLYINRLIKKHGEVTSYNTAKGNRDRHLAYLERAGIETKDYPAIIVVNEGERILRLSEWTLL